MATIKELKSKAKKAQIETIPLTPTEIKLITDLNTSKQIVVNEFASSGQLEAGLDIRKRKNNTVFEKNLESERQLSKTLTLFFSIIFLANVCASTRGSGSPGPLDKK